MPEPNAQENKNSSPSRFLLVDDGASSESNRYRPSEEPEWLALKIVATSLSVILTLALGLLLYSYIDPKILNLMPL